MNETATSCKNLKKKKKKKEREKKKVQSLIN